MPGHQLLQVILLTLRFSERSSNDPQMPGDQFLRMILLALRFLKQSSNDPQMPGHQFLRIILLILRFSKRSSNDPQTILKCSGNTFCEWFYYFRGSETRDLYNTKRLSLGPCGPPAPENFSPALSPQSHPFLSVLLSFVLPSMSPSFLVLLLGLRVSKLMPQG